MRIFLAVTSDGKFMISEGEDPLVGVHLLKAHEVSGWHSYAGQGIFSRTNPFLFQCEWDVVAGAEIIFDRQKDQFLQGKR